MYDLDLLGKPINIGGKPWFEARGRGSLAAAIIPPAVDGVGSGDGAGVEVADRDGEK